MFIPSYCDIIFKKLERLQKDDLHKNGVLRDYLRFYDRKYMQSQEEDVSKKILKVPRSSPNAELLCYL
jgi:hypothetical protein